MTVQAMQDEVHKLNSIIEKWKSGHCGLPDVIGAIRDAWKKLDPAERADRKGT